MEGDSSDLEAMGEPEFVRYVVIQANRGMDDGEVGRHHNPILANFASSQQAVANWLKEGIPRVVIAAGVYAAAKAFKPDTKDRQLRSIGWTCCDRAVRAEWERWLAARAAPARGTGESSNGASPSQPDAVAERDGRRARDAAVDELRAAQAEWRRAMATHWATLDAAEQGEIGEKAEARCQVSGPGRVRALETVRYEILGERLGQPRPTAAAEVAGAA